MPSPNLGLSISGEPHIICGWLRKGTGPEKNNAFATSVCWSCGRFAKRPCVGGPERYLRTARRGAARGSQRGLLVIPACNSVLSFLCIYGPCGIKWVWVVCGGGALWEKKKRVFCTFGFSGSSRWATGRRAVECRDGERDVRLFLPDKGGISQWFYLGRGYSGEERRFQQEPSW